jgi:heme-degrading monooxygenase HmoA
MQGVVVTDTVDPARRAASLPVTEHSGGVTLINSFAVPAGREDAFQELWTATSLYFRAQPGFLSLRLHRALSPDARYRYVNVARWASLADFQAAHATEEFRRVVSQPAWQEFPSSPALYEVAVEDGVDVGESAVA